MRVTRVFKAALDLRFGEIKRQKGVVLTVVQRHSFKYFKISFSVYVVHASSICSFLLKFDVNNCNLGL